MDTLKPDRRAALGWVPATMLAACAAPLPASSGQFAWSVELPGGEAPVHLWLYLPPGYATARERWPLVLFLHGSGERGDELERVKVHGPPKLAAAGTPFPFVLASPQLPEGRRWDASELHRLLGVLLARLQVDPARVTATGLSLGGHGCWDWATAYPDDLAGIAPVCGQGEPEDVCRMRRVPVRAYHGADDTVVPPAGAVASVEALRACGGSASLTLYPGVGHDAWNPAYQDPELVPWLLARRRA